MMVKREIKLGITECAEGIEITLKPSKEFMEVLNEIKVDGEGVSHYTKKWTPKVGEWVWNKLDRRVDQFIRTYYSKQDGENTFLHELTCYYIDEYNNAVTRKVSIHPSWIEPIGDRVITEFNGFKVGDRVLNPLGNEFIIKDFWFKDEANPIRCQAITGGHYYYYNTSHLKHIEPKEPDYKAMWEQEEKFLKELLEEDLGPSELYFKGLVGLRRGWMKQAKEGTQ